jgi:DNA polymerase III delta subunit
MTCTIHLVSGNDEARIKLKAKELVEALSGGTTDPFALEVISRQENEAPDELLKRVILSYMSPPFFGEKTIWLDDFPAFKQENASSKSAVAVEIRNLLELFAKNPAENINLVISGNDCDKRKGFYKTFAKSGEVHLFNKPEKKNRNWQVEMNKIVQAQAKEMHMSIQTQALDYLVTCLGNDTQRVKPTLETLWCYTNGQNPINLNQVQNVISGNEAADAWIFSNALSKRDLETALNSLNILLSREKDPEALVSRLLMQGATLFHNFVQAKLIMQLLKLKNSSQLENCLQSIDGEALKNYKSKYPIITYHPYRLKLIIDDSKRYSNKETLDAMDLLNSAMQKLFQNSSSKRLILESLTHRIISKSIN